MKNNNMFDRVRRRDIGFLPDLNTEHAYHCHRLLYLAFVIGEKKKGKKGKQTIVMYLQTNSTIDSRKTAVGRAGNVRYYSLPGSIHRR